MGLYNFRPHYAPMIEEGSKRHTIRAPRRYRDGPGDTMHLYVGLRRRGARRLFRAPCLNVLELAITEDGRLLLDGVALGPKGRDKLAWDDGFRPEGSTASDRRGSFDLMLAGWRDMHGLPFEGHIYYWDYERREV